MLPRALILRLARVHTMMITPPLPFFFDARALFAYLLAYLSSSSSRSLYVWIYHPHPPWRVDFWSKSGAFWKIALDRWAKSFSLRDRCTNVCSFILSKYRGRIGLDSLFFFLNQSYCFSRLRNGRFFEREFLKIEINCSTTVFSIF